MDFTQLIADLTKGFNSFTLLNAVMIAVALVLIYIAIWKEYEPVLLLPIGFGCLLANLGMSNEVGFMKVIYSAGIKTELFPLLIFIGVGAMIDFSPLLSQPSLVLLGAAGQFGIYFTLILAILLGFPLHEAAAIGSIGAIDGPTAIFVGERLAPNIIAPIAVAAYSYMSLIPIIQPFAWDEALIALDQALHFGVDPWRIAHAVAGNPLVVTVITGAYNFWLFLMYFSLIFACFSMAKHMGFRVFARLAL